MTIAVILFNRDPSTGRNFSGRQLHSDYHPAAHHVPKNFWSTEHLAHQSSYRMSTPIHMQQQSGYVYEPSTGNRSDNKYSWRTNPHSSRTRDIWLRPGPGIFPESDHFDSTRQRASWFRTEEGRSYLGRGKAAQSDKPPSKLSPHREGQKLGYNWHGRKYSDGDPNLYQSEMPERVTSEKEFHIAKVQGIYRPESKGQEMYKTDLGQKRHRGEEVEDMKLSVEKSFYNDSMHREFGNETELVKRSSDEAQLKATEGRGIDSSEPPDGRAAFVEAQDIVKLEEVPTGERELKQVRNNPSRKEALLLQPRFENVSPVLGENDGASQLPGVDVKDAVGDAVANIHQIEKTSVVNKQECLEEFKGKESKKEKPNTPEKMQGAVL